MYVKCLFLVIQVLLFRVFFSGFRIPGFTQTPVLHCTSLPRLFSWPKPVDHPSMLDEHSMKCSGVSLYQNTCRVVEHYIILAKLALFRSNIIQFLQKLELSSYKLTFSNYSEQERISRTQFIPQWMSRRCIQLPYLVVSQFTDITQSISRSVYTGIMNYYWHTILGKVQVKFNSSCSIFFGFSKRC